jgi:hypothetical protein
VNRTLRLLAPEAPSRVPRSPAVCRLPSAVQLRKPAATPQARQEHRYGMTAEPNVRLHPWGPACPIARPAARPPARRIRRASTAWRLAGRTARLRVAVFVTRRAQMTPAASRAAPPFATWAATRNAMRAAPPPLPTQPAVCAARSTVPANVWLRPTCRARSRAKPARATLGAARVRGARRVAMLAGRRAPRAPQARAELGAAVADSRAREELMQTEAGSQQELRAAEDQPREEFSRAVGGRPRAASSPADFLPPAVWSRAATRWAAERPRADVV